ncbi:MAG: hypothetical protein OXC66_14250 [Roseovarius sp.]|nr:hypothetical protein [Roseovarius sp.]
MSGRWLPGVPGKDLEAIFDEAAGNEIARGKFDNPKSSAALAGNAFGFFLHRASDLPVLPECQREIWPACSLLIEAELRFPWSGGRHPHLDCLVETPSALIGIESKRFEPFGPRTSADLSRAYWRKNDGGGSIWGEHMSGYERIRDILKENPKRFTHLDAAQLFKHAFALRTEVHRRRQCDSLNPILFYLYAEPDNWPDGKPVAKDKKNQHRKEIAAFGKIVFDDEVRFIPCSWQRLLKDWENAPNADISEHAKRVLSKYGC